jgi:hypothetical protein
MTENLPEQTQSSVSEVDSDTRRQVIEDVSALRDIFSEFEQRLFINYCGYIHQGQAPDQALFALQERYHTLEYGEIRSSIDHILAGIQAHNHFLWDYLEKTDYDLSFFPRKGMWSPEHGRSMARWWWIWMAILGALLVIGLISNMGRCTGGPSGGLG